MRGVYIRTGEIKKKQSEAMKGIVFDEAHKKKLSEVHKGKRLSESHKKNISAGNKGKIRSSRSEEWSGKISEAKKGKPSWNKGIPMRNETKEKLSLARRGKCLKEKNASWRGGKSFELYSVDWTQTLKRSIRERDHYTCQDCGMLQSDKAFDVHHKDENKKNCNPDNLITLCKKCHLKRHKK